MSKPSNKPPEFVPQYSANFIVGYSFLHFAIQAVSEAFMAGPAKR